MNPDDLLGDALLERVLDRLSLPHRPPTGLEGLATLYSAWSRAVPFDNVRKLLHLSSGRPGPLPGDTVLQFFEDWLSSGTGGTCWAGNGALCVLLRTLGFDAVRGVCTMLAAPDLPPNHGTVAVTLDGSRWLVDASMLFEEPLRLQDDAATQVDHPAWGVRCEKRDGRWHVRCRPLHAPDGFDCRIETLSATAAEFSQRHEQTRQWSPFNFEVNARRNREDSVVGIAFGYRVEIGARGEVTRTPLAPGDRDRVLAEEIGIAADVVARLPDDRPTPPPPASRTAARQAGHG